MKLCKACGRPKNHHPKFLWVAHKEMGKATKKLKEQDFPRRFK